MRGSAAVLANVSAAITQYLAPTPVNVTATLASQRRRLQQSTYTANVQASDAADAAMHVMCQFGRPFLAVQ